MAKLLGTSLGAAWCVVLPCLSSMPGIVLRALSDLEAGGFGPQSPRNSVGLRHFCHFSLAILPVLGRHGFMPRMPLVPLEEAMVLRVAHVLLRRVRQQAAVRSDGGFPPKSSSALGDLCWSKMSGELKNIRLAWSQRRRRRESC